MSYLSARGYSVDVKCEELALYFLFGHTRARAGDMKKLAQDIQDAVETYMREVDERPFPYPKDDAVFATGGGNG